MSAEREAEYMANFDFAIDQEGKFILFNGKGEYIETQLENVKGNIDNEEESFALLKGLIDIKNQVDALIFSLATT